MTRYEYGGGIVGVDSLYVERPVDRELVNLLGERRELVSIIAPRQSGKSSLITRVLQALKDAGQSVAYVDLRVEIGMPDVTNRKEDNWFRLFYEAVAEASGLDSADVAAWMSSQSDEPRVKQVITFFSKLIGDVGCGPFVIAFDEVDFVSLFGYHTDSLFEALRSLGQTKKIDLSFLLASLNHPADLLKSLGPSTFNVFHAYRLNEFETDNNTVEKWSAGLPWPERVRHTVGREVLHQTGGQPYLTSVLFQRVLESGAKRVDEVKQLAAKIAEDKDDAQLRPHFQAPQDILLHHQSRAYAALTLYEEVLGKRISVDQTRRPLVNLLVTAGLIRENEGKISVKSPIYERAFDGTWINDIKLRLGFDDQRSRAPAADRSEASDTICVINTGGMISMQLGPDGRIEEPNDLQAFFADFPETQDIAKIDTLALMCKDGTNITPADWRAVAEAIYQRRNRGYRGFVVCHGTDTLAYTASAVAFALGPGLKVPVVFTAAQVPRHVLYGDARINILRACKVATLDIPEVVVCIGDHVYRAVRAEKRDDYRFDSFHSPTMPPLATIAPTIELQKHLIRVPDRSRSIECLAEFSEGVFKITFYPGLKPTLLEPILDNDDIQGLIIETPGIGVLPTEGEYSLMGLVEQAVKKNVPVLLVSQYPIQTQLSKAYQLATLPIQAGAIPAVNMSVPTAVTKFMWVLPQVRRKIEQGDILDSEMLKEISDWMGRNIIGELNE